MKQLAWLLALGIPAAFPASLRSQSEYFPLEVGNRWTYVSEHWALGGAVRALSVEDEEDGLFVVRVDKPLFSKHGVML